jgi:hypothetical protein
MVIQPIFEAVTHIDGGRQLDYPTLGTKDLGQKGLSAENVRGNARAKAVRASHEFWSTGDVALLEQAFAEIFAEHAVRPLCETATTGLGPSRRLEASEKSSK